MWAGTFCPVSSWMTNYISRSAHSKFPYLELIHGIAICGANTTFLRMNVLEVYGACSCIKMAHPRRRIAKHAFSIELDKKLRGLVHVTDSF